MGAINGKLVMFIVVLVMGAGGYLWYSQMYTPAVVERTTALATASTAQQGLDAAKQTLATAEKALEESKKENSKVDDLIARLAKARAGVPPDELIDDAAIIVESVAREAGLETRFTATGDDGKSQRSVSSGSVDSSLQGAKALDFTFTASGRYAEFQQFFRLLEGTTEMADGKLYARGRLFNVEGIKTVSNETTAGASSDPNEFTLGPNDIKLEITIRIYASSDANDQALGATAGAATPGATGAPGAAGTPGAAGAPGAPGAAGTPTAPAAGGATNTTGAAPATGGATSPTTPAPSTAGTTPTAPLTTGGPA